MTPTPNTQPETAPETQVSGAASIRSIPASTILEAATE